MDIKQLKYFVSIVEEGNITKASYKLHISQPPLSNQLKLLENELGVKLLERGSRNVRLTDAGNLLYKRSKSIIKMFDSTIREIDDLKNGIEGMLKIGTVSTSNQFFSDNIISKYSKIYPKVKFELYEGNTYEVVQMIEKGVVEIGIVRTPFNTEDYNCIHLRKEPMVAVVGENYNIFNNENGYKITLEEIDKNPIIIYRRYENLIKSTFHKKGIEPNVYCLSDDSRTTLSWAQAGLGVGIVPKSVINLENKNIKIYEIQEEVLQSEIMAIYKDNRYLSANARNLLNLLENIDIENI